MDNSKIEHFEDKGTFHWIKFYLICVNMKIENVDYVYSLKTKTETLKIKTCIS